MLRDAGARRQHLPALEARLEGASVEGLGRRQVRCSHPAWHCEFAADSEHAFRVPFECGGSVRTQAAFYDGPRNCANLPVEVAGYLLDMNEAGGGPADWQLQVGAKPREFPDALAWMGIGFIVLGLVFPKLSAWSLARMARAEQGRATPGRGGGSSGG